MLTSAPGQPQAETGGTIFLAPDGSSSATDADIVLDGGMKVW